jgi:DNA-binding transcriptional regulator YiaG
MTLTVDRDHAVIDRKPVGRPRTRFPRGEKRQILLAIAFSEISEAGPSKLRAIIEKARTLRIAARLSRDPLLARTASAIIEHAGKGVSIENIDALQKTIALWIIDSPAPMTGAEFRFLRMELDLSQRRIAELINAEEQAVRRWEKARNKPVKGSAERMMRVLFHAYSGGDAEIRHMLDKLATLDATPRSVESRHARDG